jgi:hypothetical protein
MNPAEFEELEQAAEDWGDVNDLPRPLTAQELHTYRAPLLARWERLYQEAEQERRRLARENVELHKLADMLLDQLEKARKREAELEREVSRLNRLWREFYQ